MKLYDEIMLLTLKAVENSLGKLDVVELVSVLEVAALVVLTVVELVQLYFFHISSFLGGRMLPVLSSVSFDIPCFVLLLCGCPTYFHFGRWRK